jgi:NAD(P)-dependent dehydrogenase (short-subunit alcohol dehydrogenase family)
MAGTVLITGTDKGLGRVLLNTFLVHGYRVFAGRYRAYSTYNDSMSIGADSLSIIPLDVSDPASVEAAGKTIESMTNSLDLIINNAGIDIEHPGLSLEQTHVEVIPRVLDVNSVGPLRVVKRFLPLLRKGTGKLIINITSEASKVSVCNAKEKFGYYMSKAAVNMQSRILQNLVGEEGIKVLAIYPGWMQTDLGGANADIPPIESARGIYELSQEKWSINDPLFVTYTGREMDC